MTFKSLGVKPQLISPHPNSKTAGKCLKCNTFFGGDDRFKPGEICPHCGYDNLIDSLKEAAWVINGWKESNKIFNSNVVPTQTHLDLLRELMCISAGVE